MDTNADDLMTLVEHLDLRNAIHVGHSVGGGEVARYIGRHGAGRAKGRVAKAVLIGSVTPLMVKTPNNPGGLPMDYFDGFRARSSPIGRNFSGTSPLFSSMDSIVLAPMSRRASSTIGGDKE